MTIVAGFNVLDIDPLGLIPYQRTVEPAPRFQASVPALPGPSAVSGGRDIRGFNSKHKNAPGRPLPVCERYCDYGE